MLRIGKSSRRHDTSTGDERLMEELDRLAADQNTWGEPLSYVELLTDPSVRTRIAKLIVHSTLKRPRQRR